MALPETYDKRTAPTRQEDTASVRGYRSGKAHQQAPKLTTRPGHPVAGPWKQVEHDGRLLFLARPRRTDRYGVKRARRRERAAERRALQRARRLWSAQGPRRADDGSLVGGPLALSLEWDAGTWDYRTWRIAKCGADRAVRRSPPVYYLPRWRAR